jgi:hypothetical protein
MTIFVFFVSLGCASAGVGSNGSRLDQHEARVRAPLRPVDEAAKDASFLEFRTALLDALKRRDAAFVLAVSTPDMAEYLRNIGLELPRAAVAGPPHEIVAWRQLESILLLGGTFTTTKGLVEGRVEFCAPYVYRAYPDPAQIGFDLIESEGTPWVVLEPNVPVYSEPAPNASVLTRLSYDLVEVTGGEAPALPPVRWRQIHTPDGREGWIEAHRIRDPEDHHACFAKIGGAWRLTVFGR